MHISKPRFQRYLFVCENKRTDAECCAPAGIKIRELLKLEVQKRGLAERIRVSASGCQDVCKDGPNVLLLPNHVWFMHVTDKDVSKIVDWIVNANY